MKLIKREHQDHRQLQSDVTGEIFSKSAVLSDSLYADGLFVHHDILEPGRRASSPHFHTDVDEVVYVVKGNVSVVEGDEMFELFEGDCASFKANSKLKHYVENSPTETAELLVVSRTNSSNDVVIN